MCKEIGKARFRFVAREKKSIAEKLHPDAIGKAMSNWKRQKQERDGTYFFGGKFYATRGIVTELSIEEILFICQDLKAFVKEKNGIDYLQVYADEKGRKLFFIDQLNKEMIESGQYRDDDNHCTLMFASEY